MPTSLCVGTQPKGVFKSANGGEDWSTLSTGLIKAAVLALAIDLVISSEDTMLRFRPL
jgi:hypothetical protein